MECRLALACRDLLSLRLAPLTACASATPDCMLSILPLCCVQVLKGAASRQSDMDSTDGHGFTFVKHSPSVGATDMSPIPFIAPAGTLSRQGSSNDHVLAAAALAAAAEQPSQTANQNLTRQQSDLVLEVYTDDVPQPGMEEGSFLASPVSSWLGNAEAAPELPDIQLLGSAEAALPFTDGLADEAELCHPSTAAELERQQRAAPLGQVTSAYLQGDEQAMWRVSEKHSELLRAEVTEITIDRETSLAESFEAVSLEEEKVVSREGDGASQLEGFDSIPLTPKAGDSADTADLPLFDSAENYTANDNISFERAGAPSTDLVNTTESISLADDLAIEGEDSARSGPAEAADDAADVNDNIIAADIADTSSMEAALQLPRAPRPYSASRLRESSTKSLRAAKEAGGAAMERISSLQKSLGHLVRNTGSAGSFLAPGKLYTLHMSLVHAHTLREDLSSKSERKRMCH